MGTPSSPSCHERLALPVPEALGWPEAGGFVEVYATAHDALFTQGGLAPGERLLVNGAAGGVGLAAVQLGVSAGARVTANARHSHERLHELGADTEVEGPYDVILELVGGELLQRDLDLLGTGGRLVVIGVSGGGARVEVDFGTLMRIRGRIHASTLRARPLEEKGLVMRRLERHVLPLLAAGRVTVPGRPDVPAGRRRGRVRLLRGGRQVREARPLHGAPRYHRRRHSLRLRRRNGL